MKKARICIWISLAIFCFASDGWAKRAAVPRVVVGGSAPVSAPGPSRKAIYTQYGSILNNSLNGAAGAALSGAQLQGMLQAGMAAINSGNARDVASLLQAGMAAANSGNPDISALLQSAALPSAAVPLPQNRLSSPTPGSYGNVLTAPTLIGPSPLAGPGPSDYSLLSSQAAVVSIRGGLAPAQYASPGQSASPVICQYNLSPQNISADYVQALLASAKTSAFPSSGSSQSTGMNTQIDLVQDLTGFRSSTESGDPFLASATSQDPTGGFLPGASGAQSPSGGFLPELSGSLASSPGGMLESMIFASSSTNATGSLISLGATTGATAGSLFGQQASTAGASSSLTALSAQGADSRSTTSLYSSSFGSTGTPQPVFIPRKMAGSAPGGKPKKKNK